LKTKQENKTNEISPWAEIHLQAHSVILHHGPLFYFPMSTDANTSRWVPSPGSPASSQRIRKLDTRSSTAASQNHTPCAVRPHVQKPPLACGAHAHATLPRVTNISFLGLLRGVHRAKRISGTRDPSLAGLWHFSFLSLDSP
jgi:hypothetical protein